MEILTLLTFKYNNENCLTSIYLTILKNTNKGDAYLNS